MKATKAMSKALAVMAVFLGLVSGACAAEDLKIEQAVCGAKDSWRDVTAFLQGNVSGDTLSASIAQPFDQIGGDPAPGQVKTLIIDYRLKGALYRLSLEEQFPVAFAIQLPSSEAVAPGQDARAAALMAESKASLASAATSVKGEQSSWLSYLACGLSLVAMAGAGAALVQIRQMKKQRAQAVSQIL